MCPVLLGHQGPEYLFSLQFSIRNPLVTSVKVVIGEWKKVDVRMQWFRV